MSYRSIHKANLSYELAIMILLIVAFLIAVPLMFVHPLMVLALFFCGLVIVLATIGIEKMVHRAERAAARQEMLRHECPGCGAAINHDPLLMEKCRCQACGSVFLNSGQAVQEGDLKSHEGLKA